MKKMILFIGGLLFISTAFAQQEDFDSLIKDAKARKDSAAVIRYFIKKYDKQNDVYIIEHDREINDTAFGYFFHFSNDKNELKKAAKYLSIIVKHDLAREKKDPKDMLLRQFNAFYFDTQAGILYKSGQVDSALKLQEQAVLRFPENKEIVKNYRKMREGKPTWTSVQSLK